MCACARAFVCGVSARRRRRNRNGASDRVASISFSALRGDHATTIFTLTGKLYPGSSEKAAKG